ncbi:CCA tRNA nucleotidyltransferase [Paenibacillus sp. 453mf]|uniref:CCA tRNA nucleotidyltransferase n=1 Tax=Paenibacillus sp. 453mf TaxID=1761874 RepID=UPI0008E2E8E6|nr:CCA tRNA nucleotidyltransferase [Paenibacillus sp. 453mf]SFS59035.1 tRNA nucleotidyltransferase (CCA-adding enzyme) [Paenibacillus sp. 453mf]
MNNWKHVDPAMAIQGEEVLRRLNDHGHQAFFVGGCVRDEMMKRPVTDMDITTSAKPEEVMALFEGSIPTGLQHGTVTVRMNGYHFEVTTFRTESGYEDFRRPSEVHFVDQVEEDLKRRDFTMNAIARDYAGHIIDPFNGVTDIARGIVRSVGLAEERFREDALRMLRGVRFASIFNFDIDSLTWDGLLAERDKLSHIAMERVRNEMDKLLAGPYPARGIGLLMDSELLHYIKAPVDLSRLDRSVLSLLDKLPQTTEYRLGLLLLLLGANSADADHKLRAWTYSGKVKDRMTRFLGLHEEVMNHLSKITKDHKQGLRSRHLREEWKLSLLKHGVPASEDWHVIHRLLPQSFYEMSGEEYLLLKELVEHAEVWRNEMGVYSLKELELSGSDLLRVTGRKGGPWLGETMNWLLRQVVTGQLVNKHDILLDAAKKVISDEK